MRINSRIRIIQGMIFATLLLTLTWPMSSPRTATARTLEVKKEVVELEVRQGSRKTEIKMFVENGKVVKVVAKDGDGERVLTRVGRSSPAKVACEGRNNKCKSVELASGEHIKVCFCTDDATAELAVELMTKSLAAGGNTAQPRHRLFALVDRDPGGGGGSCTEAHPCCYEDYKLQMSVCYP